MTFTGVALPTKTLMRFDVNITQVGLKLQLACEIVADENSSILRKIDIKAPGTLSAAPYSFRAMYPNTIRQSLSVAPLNAVDANSLICELKDLTEFTENSGTISALSLSPYSILSLNQNCCASQCIRDPNCLAFQASCKLINRCAATVCVSSTTAIRLLGTI